MKPSKKPAKSPKQKKKNHTSGDQELKDNLNTPLEFTCCHCSKVGTVDVELILSNIICPHCRRPINVSHLIGLKQRIALRLSFKRPTLKYPSTPRENLVLIAQYIKHKAVQWKREFDNSDLKVYLTLGPILLYTVVKLTELVKYLPAPTVNVKTEEESNNTADVKAVVESVIPSSSRNEDKKQDQSGTLNSRLNSISFQINQSASEACKICILHSDNWLTAIKRDSADLSLKVSMSVTDNEGAILSLKFRKALIDDSIKRYLANSEDNLLFKFQNDIRVVKFRQMYTAYLDLVQSAASPSGSFTSYNNDVVAAKKTLDSSYNELQLFIR